MGTGLHPADVVHTAVTDKTSARAFVAWAHGWLNWDLESSADDVEAVLDGLGTPFTNAERVWFDQCADDVKRLLTDDGMYALIYGLNIAEWRRMGIARPRPRR